MKQSFSTSEVARYCHVTPDTIRKWAEAGRIHVFKTPGGHRRIRREDLIHFLRENSIPIHSELSNSSLRVLIVAEDNATVSVVSRFLEHAQNPCELGVAANGFEAGHQVTSFRPDVVFLDTAMHGVDAEGVCRRIRELPELAATNIITLADGEDSEAGERSVEAGAVLCLHKPFTPDDLRRALARVGVEVG